MVVQSVGIILYFGIDWFFIFLNCTKNFVLWFSFMIDALMPKPSGLTQKMAVQSNIRRKITDQIVDEYNKSKYLKEVFDVITNQIDDVCKR